MDEPNSALGLAQSIESYPPTDPETGETIQGFLGKFVMLAEWMDKDGNKYLVRKYANGMGDSIPGWDVKGLLFEGLFGGFD